MGLSPTRGEIIRRLEVLNEQSPSPARVELVKGWLKRQDPSALQDALLDPEFEERYPEGLRRLVTLLSEIEREQEEKGLVPLTRGEGGGLTTLAEGAKHAFDAEVIKQTIQDLMVSSEPERIKRAVRTLALFGIDARENAEAFLNAYRKVREPETRAEIADLFIASAQNVGVLEALKDLLLADEKQSALERLINIMVSVRSLSEIEEELIVVPLVEALQRGGLSLPTRQLIIRELARIAPVFDKLPEYRERLQVALINLLRANPKELRAPVAEVFANLGTQTRQFLWRELDMASYPEVRRMILESLSLVEEDEAKREQLAELLVNELQSIVRNVFEEERMQEALVRLGDYSVSPLLEALKVTEEQKRVVLVRTVSLFWEKGLQDALSPTSKERVASALRDLLDYGTEHVKVAVLRSKIFSDSTLEESTRENLIGALIRSIELFLSNTMVRPVITERLKEMGALALKPLFEKLKTARFGDEKEMVLQAVSDIIYELEEAELETRQLVDAIAERVLRDFPDRIKLLGRLFSSPVVSSRLVQQAVHILREKMKEDYHLSPFVWDAFGEMMRRRKDFSSASRLSAARDMAGLLESAKEAIKKFNIRSSVLLREFREVAVRVLGNIYLGGRGLKERQSIIRILASHALKGTMDGWGVNEIENLRQTLSRVVNDPSTPDEDKVEVALVLKRQPDKILQMDYFGDICLAVEGNEELTSLASKIALNLLEMRMDDARKRKVVYEILGKIGARKELIGIKDSSGREVHIRARIVDTLLSALRSRHLGAREALEILARSPHLPEDLSVTVASELKRASQVRL